MSQLIVRIPMRFQRRGGRKRIVAPDGSEIVSASKPQPDGTLVKALARAWRWQRMLDEGVYSTVSEIGDTENISKSYVSRILGLALLSPDIIDAILARSADQSLMLVRLERPLPASWVEQRARILEPKAREPDRRRGAAHLTVSSIPNRTDMTSRTWARPATSFSTTVSF
jgi:hypothetical protein